VFPWGHAAFGYLLYSVYTRVRYDRIPGDVEAIVLAFATQLPDLIDKPLSWTIGLTATGKSVGHSVIGFVLLSICVGWAVHTYGRTHLGEALCLGVGTHFLGDVIEAIIENDSVGFLFWPMVIPEGTSEGSIIAVLLRGEQGPMAGLEYALVLFALMLWVFDGCPGLSRRPFDSFPGSWKRSE
jgi:hypothetical protein